MGAALLPATGVAQAPTAAVPAAPPASAAERLVRAQRDASRPMQIIIEAARARARPAAPTPTAAPAAASTLVVASTPPVAARQAIASPAPAAPGSSVAPVLVGGTAGADAASVEPVVTTSSPAATATPGAVLPVAPPTGEVPAGVGPARAAPTGLVPAAMVPAAMVPTRTLATAPEAIREAAPLPARATPEPARQAVAPTATSGPDQVVVPRLVGMVEPEIPPRAMARLSRPAAFQVAFTIRPDGSVDGVGVRGGDALRAMETAVASAVQQWRYAPVPRAMAHQVELVIRPD